MAFASARPVSSGAERYRGTGLGLALSRKLTELMEEEIHLESVAGEAHPIAPPATRVPLLLAEDNPVNRKVAVLLLERLGYRVDVATNGREALERLAGADYRAILMDCQMLELDGYEATAVIRSQERGGARIPIIAMTANAMAGDRERCLAAGMDDYLSKPIQLAMLAQVMARWAPTGCPPAEPSGQPDVPGLRRELAGLFLEDAPARLAELEAAHRQGDREAIRRAAHQLKGTAATVGATQVAKSAAELETIARAADLEAVPEVLARLRTELDRVHRAAP